MDTERADALLMRAIQLDAQLLGRPDAGRAEAQAVIDEARTARHQEATVIALRSLAWAHREMFEYDEAADALEAAARTARRHGLKRRLADVLMTRAGLHLERGNSLLAQRDLRAARVIVGDSASAELEFLQGRFEQAVGRLADAAASYQRALDAGPSPVIRVKTLNNLGGVLGNLGHLDRAERALVEGKGLAKEVGPAIFGYLCNTLGWLALQRGRLPEALRRFDEGDVALAEAGAQTAEWNLVRLDALLTMRLPTESAELAQQIVKALREPGNALILAQALQRQATALLLADDFDGAAQSAAEARALFLRQRRLAQAALATTTMASARLALGSVDAGDVRRCASAAATLADAGNVNEALDANLILGRVALQLRRQRVAAAALERAVAISRGGPVLHRVRGRLARALLACADGDRRVVQRAALGGLRALETYRATLASPELRALASGHGAELAALGLEAALSAGRPPNVLRWLERGRVRSLLDIPVQVRNPQIATALTELRGLASQQSVGDDTTANALSGLRSAQARLEREVLRLGRTVDADGPSSQSATSPAEIQSALGDRALVEFGVHDGKLVAVTATKKRLRLFRLGAVAEVEVEQDYLRSALQRLGTARDERAGARARAAAESALSRLDDLLLSPLRGELDGAAAVVVVPTARLLGVAWSALPSVRQRHVVVAPAAAMWLLAEQRSAGKAAREHSVALVAGPRLDGAVAEVEALATLHRGAKALTPPDSTVDAVLSAIDGAALAHLACHGRFRADNPTFSALDMADGPLTVHDLEQIDRLPQCLVLAACDSGLSEAYPGEELLGFLARLLAGGTATVIASVVPVPDVDTVPLMLALHRSLKAGASAAAALASARAEVVDSSAQGFLAATAFACFGSG